MRSDAILERLLTLHPKKIDLSLGRIQHLLEKLGHPEKTLPPVIHIAGTNGKGSTTAFLRAILEAAGRRVHVYTSPHLVRFHERIRLGAPGGGRLVDEAQLTATLADCERINAGDSITFFEITTAAALLLFAQVPADVVLLEVGLGGRVDSTNVIDHPAATIITPVSIDHREFLGDTLEAIAFEKAGILKAGVPGVLGRQAPAARAVIARQAARLRAPLRIAGEDFSAHEEGGRLIYQDETGLLDMPLPRLAGHHQRDNAATAIAALRGFDASLPARAYEEGLSQAVWPARLQPLTRGALVAQAPAGAELWLDGGHNAAGGQALASAMRDLAETAGSRPLVLICGMLATKDAGAFLAPFRGLAQELLAIPIPGDHSGRTPQDLATIARDQGLSATTSADVETALATLKARVWPVPPRVLMTGSLYLAGDVLARNGTPPD